MTGHESVSSVHLSEYIHILKKHKNFIIASLLITVTLTMLFSFLMKPVYRAETTMVIGKEKGKSLLTGERLDFESYSAQSLTFNTHFKLITSRHVLEKVANNLNLDNLKEENRLQVNSTKKFLRLLKQNTKLLFGIKEDIPSPQEKMAGLVKELSGKIDISEVRDTRLLKIYVEDHDPVLACKIANNLATTYIEYNIENHLKSSQNTMSWMTDQLYEMKKKLEDAESEFMAFKRKEKLFSIEGKQNVITQKISEFNDEYIRTRNKRMELDTKFAELEKNLKLKGKFVHVRTLVGNTLTDNLYSQLLDAEVERTRLSKVFKSKHPKILQINSKIEKTRAKLNDEIKKEMDNLKTEHSILYNNEKVLEKTIIEYENDALDTNRKELKYGILKRNVDTNQKLYDTLLSKIKESNIEGTFDGSNIRIAENAVLPPHPVKPKKMINLVLSIILGLMTFVILAFFIEYMDRSIKTEEDVQRYIDLPVLSIIPMADNEKFLEKRTA
jgi:polysaccharide biosynthesis transport protein